LEIGKYREFYRQEPRRRVLLGSEPLEFPEDFLVDIFTRQHRSFGPEETHDCDHVRRDGSNFAPELYRLFSISNMASLGEDLLGIVNKLQDLVFNTIGNDSLDLPQIV